MFEFVKQMREDRMSMVQTQVRKRYIFSSGRIFARLVKLLQVLGDVISWIGWLQRSGGGGGGGERKENSEKVDFF